MKKLFYKVLFLFLFVTSVNAQSLKDVVCIVKSNLSEKTTIFLTNYRDSLKKQGYSKYASSIDSYLKGSFGSGFVYEASNGKKYIITNRHVVSDAETATVQFEKNDGTYDEYKDLKIIAVDDDLDVALIEFPSTVRKTAIPVKTSSVNDGDDVWTAGFPGLAGKPAWQFGKGSVTNSSARIEELVSPEVSVVIQHSAQIDGGNSGGPLLVKNSSSAYGYSVVGINTWKALNRENTNFAIPINAVVSFVNEAISKKNSNSSITGRLNNFNASISNKDETFGRMASYISNDMVSSISSKTFLKITDGASKDAQEVILANFVVDPLAGIRYALASYVWNVFRNKGNLLPYTTSNPDSEDNFYNVTFVVNEKNQYTSKWIEEQGIWKLADFNGLVSEDGASVGVTGVSISNPYSFNIYGGAACYPFETPLSFTVGFDIVTEDLLSLGFFYSSDEIAGQGYNILNAKAKLMIPVNFGKFILIPYGFYGFGTFLEKDGSAFDFTFGSNYGGGIEFVYDMDSFAPYVGVQYCGKSFKPDPFEDLKYSKNSVDVLIGIKLGKNSGLSLW